MKSMGFIFIFLFLLLSGISNACDLCGCFIPGDTASKGLRFSIAEQYSSLSNLYLEGESVANHENQYMNSANTQFIANYHINEASALQLSVPVLYRSFQRVEDGAIQSGNESGIGDIWLSGYYVPHQRKTPESQFTWKVIGGLKFPTGNSDRLAEELEEDHHSEFTHSEDPAEEISGVHGHDLTLGTGSWDAMIGTDLFARKNRWFANAHLQYSIRTTGDFEYRFANDLLWYGGSGYYLTSNEKYSLGLQSLFTGERKPEDSLNGEKLDDTSINIVSAGPIAILGINRIATIEGGITFPFVVDNTGLQTVPGYRIRAAITWQFH